MATSLPLRKTERVEHDTPTCQRIIDLREAHVTYARIHTITGVRPSSAWGIVRRGIDLIRRNRPNRAPEYKISEGMVLQIAKDMENDWGKSSLTTQEIIDEWDLDCCETTLLNAFKRYGIGHFWAAQCKFLTQKNKDIRKDFAAANIAAHEKLEHPADYYKNIVYSDACHFAVNQTRTRKVFRPRGRDKHGALWRYKMGKFQRRMEVQKVSTSVAAMVGWDYKSELVLISRHIDGKKYIDEFLDPIVRPFFEKERAKGNNTWIFEEDNEGAHGTGSILNAPNDYKNTHRITQMKPRQPPNAGDLSPIENVWKVLKQRVKARKPTTQAQLRQFIFEEWEKISIPEINALILTMPQRIQECYDRDGEWTGY